MQLCSKSFAESGVFVSIANAIYYAFRLDLDGVLVAIAFMMVWVGVRFLVRNRPVCPSCAPLPPSDGVKP